MLPPSGVLLKEKPFESREISLCNALSIQELLSMDIPPRENILAPWLPAQGLAMVYAPRGVGKTHLSIGIAVAVASGSKFLNWTAPKPRGVLFIDGEMPLVALQERVAYAVSSIGEPTAPLVFITPDSQDYGMPDLASSSGQAAIADHITDEIGLIIVDNLSTLVRSGKENEGESWQPVQTWALSQRSKGKSILFIHHSGKSGNQRGTSRREDVLDTVIALRRPPDYKPEQGAVFEVHFEKARGIYGDDTQSFEAVLINAPDGSQSWTTRSLEESTFERVVSLYRDGLKPTEIANELGKNRSTISRHINKAKEELLMK